MRAAIYCRVSTDDQAREGTTSLSTQREACISKAHELGYETPGDYTYSETWTGINTDRPRLNELRDNIKQRHIDAVICYSTDRLARNPIHIAIIAEECQKHDIELLFVTEPMDNSPEGQLIRYVKGFAAQVEHEKIKERTMRGKIAGLRLGKLSTGGTAPFGYNQVEGKRVINEHQAEIVRAIFNKLAYEGYTLYRLANELNLAGISGPRGGRWSEHTVHRIVNNTAYMGVTYAFRYKVVKPKKEKTTKAERKTHYELRTHIFRDKSEWIEVPGATPAIVIPKVYLLAQKQLERNRHKTPGNRIHQYLLSGGRLRCGACGHSMAGGSKRKGNSQYRYYRCVCNMKPNYYSHCEQRSISANRIEPLVWDELSRILANPDILEAEILEQRKNKEPVTLEADRVMLESNIANSQAEESRYLRQYGKGLINEKDLESEISRVRKYREQQEAKLADIETRLREYDKTELDYKQFSDVIKIVASRLEGADFETKLLTLDALNIRAILYPGQVMTLTGSIPARVSIMLQRHHRTLRHDMGRGHAARGGQAEQPRTGA